MRSKHHPKADTVRLIRLENYLREPRTMEELIKYMKVTRRIIFRDFKRLEERNKFVARVGLNRPTVYQLLEYYAKEKVENDQ